MLGIREDEALQLADAIREVKGRIKRCAKSVSVSRKTTFVTFVPILVVKRAQFAWLNNRKMSPCLNRLQRFTGVTTYLHGRISPFDGVGPEDLTIAALVKRVRTGEIREIVMATNPTLEGDGTALFISNLLANDDVQITRLARGIASGSVLEFANKEMLADALNGRQQF